MAEQTAHQTQARETLRGLETSERPKKSPADAAAAAVLAGHEDAAQEPKAYVDHFVVPSEGE